MTPNIQALSKPFLSGVIASSHPLMAGRSHRTRPLSQAVLLKLAVYLTTRLSSRSEARDLLFRVSSKQQIPRAIIRRFGMTIQQDSVTLVVRPPLYRVSRLLQQSTRRNPGTETQFALRRPFALFFFSLRPCSFPCGCSLP